ncbi:MAG: alpha-ketoacid dehydrogenase subunit beta, partial [Chitinophagales bacterium]
NTQTELNDIYRSYTFKKSAPVSESKNMRFVDAISEGLDEAMKKYDELVIMGQDVAEYGGVFKITQGFVEKYGKDRVRNTPLCESAILGAAVGLSLEGIKSIVEMQFADFVSSGFNQVVNNIAKLHYRWGQNVDCVIRMPTGAGVTAGPFHSQSNEAWFFHTPGLKIVYPATPEDAKGLLIAAVEDPNPVLYFEHKFLYRSLSAEVPSGYYNTKIGKARKVQEGNEISIICYGLAVVWAEEISREFEGNSIEILDLRSLAPLDYEAINETVKKTGKILILHEDTLTGGIGGEISAYISEHLFEYLDAPPRRVAALDTPVPFTGNLENNFLPKTRIKTVLAELINY